MDPTERRPAVRSGRAEPAAYETPGDIVERQAAAAAALALTRSVAPKLAKMLLPGERVTFGTAVHPVVLLLPFFLVLAIELLFAVGLPWLGRRPGDGWLRTGFWPKAEIGFELVLFAGAFGLFVKRLLRFWSLRIVATNRRIFAIRGVIVRRITPLGNTALAGSTLAQGFFGRMFGYGSIELPLARGTPERFRDMRDALQLYREFQAVANGVEGEAWTPAVRQTVIP